MEQIDNQQPLHDTPPIDKPDNNLVMAILTTICCCLPLGIVAIIKASKVNGLYVAGQYAAAMQAAADAKKWSMIGIICGAIINIAYFIFYFFVGFAEALGK